MDANRNGAIERSEWNGTAASFNVHDWNGDGVLSGEEVRVGGRRAARVQAENDFDPTGPATWTARNFRVLDRNRDNGISSSEWYYSPEYFRRADRDRNGVLTTAEFTGAAWDDDRDDRFENLDVNKNGRVEAGEWHGSRDAFEWLDRNRDNFLSRAEVVGETGTAPTSGTPRRHRTPSTPSRASIATATACWIRRNGSGRCAASSGTTRTRTAG